MKKILVSCLVLGAWSMLLVPALRAKTVVPTLQRVNSHAAKSKNKITSKKSSGTEEQAMSPLDELFAVRYAYPKTRVSKNVVALEMTKNGTGICSGVRYHERWIATAAHCLNRFGTTTNPRVVAGVEQLDNGVWLVNLSEPSADAPANATIYFYRKGYEPSGAYGHAEDIAIIGFDRNDKMISSIEKNIKKLDTALSQMQKMEDITKGNNSPVSDQIGRATSAQVSARRQMAKAIADKKRFLRQPLDAYHFMTFSPESARSELAGRTAYGYWFEPIVDNEIVTNRKLPATYPFVHKGIPTNDDHTVQWTGQEPGGMSGTPFIIRGYVVGFGSGEGNTSLLTDDFTNFLKRYMGLDYRRGLCVRSVANEEAVSERTQP